MMMFYCPSSRATYGDERTEYMPKFALKTDGLCGYGGFSDMAEAEETAGELARNAGDYWQEYPFVAFYEGYDNGWDELAGDLFLPEKLVIVKEVKKNEHNNNKRRI